MAENKGNRATDSEVDSGAVEQEKLVEGWCLNCTSSPSYHLGDEKGECISCECVALVLDPNNDILSRLNSFLVKMDTREIEPVEYEDEEVEVGSFSQVVLTQEPFIGKACRECKSCGNIKLYKEFKDSRDPATLCAYCAWEKAIGEEELEYLEEDLAYQEALEALERQEMIDEVLRQLDE